MTLSIRNLIYATAAGRELSIAKAAEISNIAPASITAAINALETACGVKLFIRQPSKGLKLTTEGRIVLNKSTLILESFKAYEADIKSIVSSPSGPLSIACFGAISPFIMPPVIKLISNKYPGIIPRVHDGNLEDVQGMLLDGQADVALTYDFNLKPDVSFEILSEAAPHVVLSPDHPLANVDEISICELETEPMVLLDLPISREYFVTLFEAYGLQPHIVHRTESYEMVRNMVGAGLGYALLNMRPLRDITYGGTELVRRPLKETVRPLRFVIAYYARCKPTRVANIFMDACRDYFRSEEAKCYRVEKTGSGK